MLDYTITEVEFTLTAAGLLIWTDLVRFCEIESERLEAFTDDLDFGRLDGRNLCAPYGNN